MKLLLIALALTASSVSCTSRMAPNNAEVNSCRLLVAIGAQYNQLLATERRERMQVMRFASEAAMNAYIEETNRFLDEADRLNRLLVRFNAKHGEGKGLPPLLGNGATEQSAARASASADECAAKFLE
ncbi:MAG: hypothetical protein CVT79_03005 [Alphaproteobacteria bacterium HGW-Alphaproteobacteria-18]|nr:MAG: hypothetical protein CVT79_03005 [Alphaproteobacteria bacterium HGW-Alphaproteobacteria-18]